MRRNAETTTAIGMLIGDLANTVQSIEDRVEECKKYINRERKMRADVINSIKEAMAGEHEDLHAFVGVIQDQMLTEWPSMPYFMRKEDY